MNKTNQIYHYYQVYLEEAEYSRGLSKDTIKGYLSVMKTFLNIMPEIQRLEDFSPSIIIEFFKRINRRAEREGRKIKVSTIYTYHTKLNIFFGWLEDQRYIAKRSLYNQIQKPKQPNFTDTKALDDFSVERIISAMALECIKDTFMSLRDLTMLYTLLYTGIRRGELLNLRIQDIDLESKTISIQASTSKTRKGRQIPINPILLLSLKKYLKALHQRKTKSNRLFISSRKDTPLKRSGLKSWCKRYSDLSGVKFCLHQLRHTFACSLAKQNADVVIIKCALGHSSITMTERYLRSIGSENTRVFIDQLSF